MSGRRVAQGERLVLRDLPEKKCDTETVTLEAWNTELGRCGGSLVFFRFRSDETELLQLVPQSVAADVEQARGVRLIAVGPRHGNLHQLALHFFQRCSTVRNLQLGQAAPVGQLLAGQAAVLS